MEVAGVAVGETTRCAVIHIDRKIGYLVHFKRNISSLKINVEKLTAMRNDVQRLIDAALNNNELIKEAVQTWLARVETVCGEVIRMNEEAEQINRWFKGWCCSRLILGRRAEKKISVIQGLLNDRNTFGDSISNPKPNASIEVISTADFMMFASRETTIEKVIHALDNDKVTLVGVYGMPGVGKTMLIKEIAKHVKKKEFFDEVVMVIVSQNLHLKKLQGDIAKALGMKLEEEDTMLLRATKLSERLNQDKKTLVILDDLWERIELAEVGILNCKVAFTTRDQDVCNLMEAHQTIEVALLSQQDSWSLFRQKAGEKMDSPTHQAIARDILSESKGLPLAIVTLGRALRGKDEIVWANTHRELKKSIFEGMNPVVSSIKLSYNYLQGESTKLCFLFCCLFPEDYKIDIDVLLCYVMGEKLLRNVDTLEEARDRLHAEVDKLTSASLLLRDGNKYIRMHDVVRDVAVSIASEEWNGFIVKAGMKLTEWPSMELDKCKRLSLMATKIRCHLPSQLKGAHLLTLSLNGNRELHDIPPDFFAEMKSLLTLDLSYTRIESLPPSLSCLVNLSILHLQNCFYLSNISPVERLKKLEILSIRHSNIVRLPETFGRLTNLKLLDLSHTAKLKTISTKSILSMSHLEELYTMNGYREWEMEGIKDGFHHWKELAKFNILIATTFSSSFDETEYYLKSKLFKRSMCLEIPSNSVANWMTVLVEKANLLYLHKCKGLETVAQLDPKGLDNNLKFLHVSECAEMEYLITSTVVKSASRYALSNLEDLHLDELKNFLGMYDGNLPQGFLQNLKALQVLRCNKVISLIPCELLVRLNNLVELRVAGCQGLKKLIDFEVKTLQCSETVEQIFTCNASTISKQSKMHRVPDLSPTFSKLRCLFIAHCDQLKYLLPMRVVRNLLQLQGLEIMHCLNMETIIEHDEDDCDAEKDEAILSQLSNLYLKKLPTLCSFGREGLLVEWPSLEVLTVSKCENLKRLPIGTKSVPKLRTLRAKHEWFNHLEWEDQSIKSRLQSVSPWQDESSPTDDARGTEH